MKLSLKYTKKQIIAAGIGFLFGLTWLIAMRAILYQPTTVHYHANFAVFINGERDPFESFTFYEEVEACSTGENNPKRRVHLHDYESDIVHVHDTEVTWGNFFENLGYSLGDSFIKTDAGIFEDQIGGELSFVVNGSPVNFLANTVIGDEDRVLINFGTESDQELLDRANSIALTAADYNKTADPAACSGSDDEQTSIWTRFKKAITY